MQQLILLTIVLVAINALIAYALVWSVLRIIHLVAVRRFAQRLLAVQEYYLNPDNAAIRAAGRQQLFDLADEAATSKNKFIRTREFGEWILRDARCSAQTVGVSYGDLSAADAASWVKNIQNKISPLLLAPAVSTQFSPQR